MTGLLKMGCLSTESPRAWKDRFGYSVQEVRKREEMQSIKPESTNAIFSMLRSMLSFRPESQSDC